MAANRQDAWTEAEDLLLAETVLRHIREGGTQLAAFEEVAEQLSRTSAACGFRWNSTIRRKYAAEIRMAKKQRTSSQQKYRQEKREKRSRGQQEAPLYGKRHDQCAVSESTLNMDTVIAYLRELGDEQGTRERVQELLEENERLRTRLEEMEKEKDTITQDYRALIDIMERARHLTADRVSAVGESM